MEPISDILSWRTHLQAAAGPFAVPADRLGTGALDEPLLIGLTGRPPTPCPQPLPSAEVGLWWIAAVRDVPADAEELIERANGPLFEQDRFSAIEVWTEVELCAMHALWRIARCDRLAALNHRLASAREWHLTHTQPDNATNRPWALHVFLLAGSLEGNHYAQTLLHNCMAVNGVPDTLSAWILLDAARELELAAQSKQAS